MASRRDRQRNQDEFDSSESQNYADVRPRSKSRWPYFLLLLLVIVLFLPNVVTLLGLEQNAISMFTGDLKGQLKIGRTSAGWFQPVTLKNVSLIDENDQTVLSVAEVKSSKRLWSFCASAFGDADYGHFELRQPVINLRLRQNGSNLEDVLANYLNANEVDDARVNANLNDAAAEQMATASATTLPSVSIKIIDGAASITSVGSQGAWSVDQLEMDAQLTTDAAAASTKLECRVTPFATDAGGTPIPQAGGMFQLAAEVDPGQSALTLDAIHAQVQSQSVPLSVLGPIAERFVGPTDAQGQLDCQLETVCDLRNSSMRAKVQSLNVADLQLASYELLGADRFQLANAKARGDVTISPETLSADQFEFDSDVGKIRANGKFELANVTQSASGATLPDADFQMNGQLDLAGLMKMLPATFHTHQDLQVMSGIGRFQIASQQRQLLISLDMADLKARRGDEQVVWQEPVRVVGNVADTPQGIKLTNLRCQTDFMTLEGNASFSEAVFGVKGDLGILTQRVGEFVDLQSMDFSGIVDGKFGWQMRSAAGQAGQPKTIADFTTPQDRPMEMIGSFVVSQPVIRMPGLPDWKQDKATVQLEAKLNALADGKLSVDEAFAKADLGSEQVLMTLAVPVPDVSTQTVWQFNTQAIGDVGGYLRHAQNFVDLGPIAARGKLDLKSGVTFDGARLRFKEMAYTVAPFALDAYGVVVRENQISGDGTFDYDLNTGVIDIAQTTFSSSAVSASGQNLQVIVSDNLQINGDVALRGNVNRVADWLQISPTDDSVFLFGDAEGKLRLASDGDGIGATVDVRIADLTAAMKKGTAANQTTAFQMVSQQSSFSPLWTEKQVLIRGGAKLSNDFDAVALNQLQLDSNTLTANATGTIKELSSRIVTDLNGVWNPQWELVNALLDVYTGRTVRLQGTGEQPFIVRGPLFEVAQPGMKTAPYISPDLQASTRVAWAGGKVLELPVGKGITEVIVDQGVVSTTVQPIDFSGGQIQLSPKIDLRTDQPMLYLDRQRIMNQVQLTPETCAAALKYINPLAAGATSAQGIFSVDSDGVQVPLMDPMQTQARVTVTLQDVVVSAGPMAEQLLGVAKQIQTLVRPDKVDPSQDYNTWLRMSEQTVPVAIQNGRVYHDGIRFSHDDIAIETSGSVGLDQTVEMVAKIPIPDSWLSGSEYLAGLKGQSISIPIKGTVSQPVLDRNAVRNFSADLAKQAAGNALNKVLGDKISPKINEYQTRLNEKLGGEINQVQNKLQNKLQEKLQENFGSALQKQFGNGGQNDIQRGIQNRLEGFLGGGNQASPAAPVPAGGTPSATGTGANAAPTPTQKLESELIRGIGNLFKN